MDAVLARVDYGPAASRVRHDASAALAHPLLDAVASFGDCGGSPALALVGTVAMTYRGHRYNLPVEIVLPPGYPAAPPRVFLRPTPDMSVRDRHRHVDAAAPRVRGAGGGRVASGQCRDALLSLIRCGEFCAAADAAAFCAVDRCSPRTSSARSRSAHPRRGACCRDLRELVPALRDATRASLGDETRADDGTEYFFEHAQFAVSSSSPRRSGAALARGTALGFMGRARRSHRKGEVVVEEAFGAGSASSAADDGQRFGPATASRPARSAYDAKMALVRDADVVCATCVGAGADLLDRFHFDRVLVDEAAQATEPVCLVLVGDQCQLPPTVLDAKQGEVAKPLFTRLLATVRPHLLDTQYRMHPVLSAFANDAVYAGRLCDGVHPRDRALEDRVLRSVGAAVGAEGLAAALPFALVHVRARRDAASKSNDDEAAAVARAVGACLAGGLAPADIAVLSPYSAQVRAVRRALRNAGVDCAAVGLEVSSVDAIQGREKEVVILSTVRANAEGKLGFVADWRRLNVALTRARRCALALATPARSRPTRRSGGRLGQDAWTTDSDDAGATKDGGWGDDDA
ncbi:hypothetical protein JL720_5933 [Aureococcus anophagefferens]|nr:hypothetical protein JL720_5933 [Aureococcus anophagefferens]